MPENNKLRFGLRELVALILIGSAIFFFVNYNLIGLRIFAGMLLLFLVPFYIFLDSFELEFAEKLIFSFFIGLGIVPLLAFYLTRMLGSFRISLIVCFVVLTLVSFLFRKFYRKNKKISDVAAVSQTLIFAPIL